MRPLRSLVTSDLVTSVLRPMAIQDLPPAANPGGYIILAVTLTWGLLQVSVRPICTSSSAVGHFCVVDKLSELIIDLVR